MVQGTDTLGKAEQMKYLSLIFLLGCTQLPTQTGNTVTWHNGGEWQWRDSCWSIPFRCEESSMNLRAVCWDKEYPVYAVLPDSIGMNSLQTTNILYRYQIGYVYLPDTVYQIIGDVYE
jgi:hypothetical protein